MHHRLMLCALLCLLLAPLSGFAQISPSTPLQIEAEAGFNGAFRPNEWLSIRVTLTNTGAEARGVVTVRPESNGRALSNAYETPFNLPSGATQAFSLMVRLRDFARIITLEALNEDGIRLATLEVPVQAVDPSDKLYLHVASSDVTTLTLGEVHPNGANAISTRLLPQDLPDTAPSLLAVDVLLISAFADEAFTTAQRDALRDYVLAGGHLVLLGGTTWQGMAQTFADLSPFTPSGTRTLSELSALGAFAFTEGTLAGNTPIFIGSPQENADIMVQTEDGLPLVVRQTYGAGVVDALAFNPTLAPFTRWAGADAFWFSLFSSVPIEKSWSRGMLDPVSASEAIAILPSESLYPPVAALIIFIVAYVVVIAPLNLAVLSFIKRREWAWITIPLTVALFSVVAVQAGFSGRDNQLIISTVRVVEAWHGQDLAIERGTLGVLSPNRAVHTLSFTDERPVYLLPSVGQSPSSIQSSLQMAQVRGFTARDFVTTGGIFSSFATWRTVDAPRISGALSVIQREDGTLATQGSLRNDTDQDLTNAVLLAHGVAYYLNEPLRADSLLTLDAGQFLLPALDDVALPSVMQSSADLTNASLNLARVLGFRPNDLITAAFVTRNPAQVLETEREKREQLRRELVASAFIRDQYRSTALTDGVYLLGWSENAPNDFTIQDATWRTLGNTFYIIELDVTPTPLASVITVPPYKVVWTVLERENAQGGMDDVQLSSEGDSIFTVRLMPLRPYILSEVTMLTLEFERTSGFASETRFEMWNWNTEAWEDITTRRQITVIDENAERFVGHDNAVLLRARYDFPSGTARLRDIRLAYTGKP